MEVRGASKFEAVLIGLILAACSPMKPNIGLSSNSSTCSSRTFDVQSTPRKAVHVSRTLRAGTRLIVVFNEVCLGTSTKRKTKAIELETSSPLTTDDVRDLAENGECIEEIGESPVWTKTAVPNDQYFPQQGHLTNLRFSAGHDIFFSSTGISPSQEVIIAVIDTGVDIDHPDLRNRLWVNPGEVPGNNVDDDGNGYVDDVNGYNFVSDTGNPRPQDAYERGTFVDDNGHGTHVAGLAAAQSNNTLGVAGVMGSNIKIMSLNIFGTSSTSSGVYIYNALRYAIDNGAHVVNMSLSAPGRDSIIDQTIDNAVNNGLVLLAAAGNRNEQIGASSYTPASYGASRPGLITIGASDAATSTKCAFSNYSTTYVELAAPGAEDVSGANGLLSTYLNSSLARVSGTSMSTPIAAGAVALTMAFTRSRGYNLSPATIENILTISGRVEPGVSQMKGSKHLDLLSLAQYLNANYPSAGGGTGGSTGSSTGGTGASTGTSTGESTGTPTCVL